MGKGIKKIRDGHYCSYIARKVPGGRTKVRIYKDRVVGVGFTFLTCVFVEAT